MRPNFLPWCLALLRDERRPQNRMPAHDPIKTPFEDIHVQRAQTIQERLKTVAVELRMQFFEKPDLLLGKGKRNRFRMWRTIDALGTRALRLVTAPSLDELEKLSNRGIVEDVGETDVNVKLFFDQPGQGGRGKRIEAAISKRLWSSRSGSARSTFRHRARSRPSTLDSEERSIRCHCGNHERRLLRGRLRCQWDGIRRWAQISADESHTQLAKPRMTRIPRIVARTRLAVDWIATIPHPRGYCHEHV